MSQAEVFITNSTPVEKNYIQSSDNCARVVQHESYEDVGFNWVYIAPAPTWLHFSVP